ncbi:uracil DNA glycosylase [Tulasnella sp. 419]|nr:uracil DNA glycosylase [Tulasnella sp. 419]
MSDTQSQDAIHSGEATQVETQVTTEETSTIISSQSTRLLKGKRPAPSDEDEGIKKRKGTLDAFIVKKATTPASQPTASTSTTAPESEPDDVLDTPALVKMPTTQETIAELERRTMAKSWRDALEPEFKKQYFIQLKEFIQAEYASKTIFPPAKDVYSWSRLTHLNNVKVVIIGQDPYHGPGQAHGLAFSVRDPVRPPPSLVNIYKQLASDFPDFKIPKSGDLTAVAKQGVLWLNTSLTVRNGQAGSHAKKGWETFTAAVLKAVLNRPDGRGVVFLVWGTHAQKVCDSIGINKSKHCVLNSAHPSPLSASKGFFGNQHFKKANKWLKDTYGEEIDWTVLNPPAAKS